MSPVRDGERIAQAARAAMVGIAVFAAANIVAGVALGFYRPRRPEDLTLVYSWCRDWLIYGRDLYAVPDSLTDYPPNAIVFLAPIVAVPEGWLLVVWTAVGAVWTAILPWSIARATNPQAPIARTIMAALLFLCWACVRHFLQFGQLSVALAFIAVLVADSRPRLSGASLALALIKPHVAGPIAVWMLVTRRFRVVCTAASIIASAVAVYCLRAHVTPLSVARNYVGVLASYYSGPQAWVGRTSLRPWVTALTGDRRGDLAWIGTSLALLAIPCAMAWTDRARQDLRRAAAVRALLCVWALLSTFQLAYNFFLFLPAFMFLLEIEHPSTRLQRYVAAGILQAALTLDMPIRLTPFLPSGFLQAASANLDRLLAVATFVYITYLWTRLTPSLGESSRSRSGSFDLMQGF